MVKNNKSISKELDKIEEIKETKETIKPKEQDKKSIPLHGAYRG